MEKYVEKAVITLPLVIMREHILAAGAEAIVSIEQASSYSQMAENLFGHMKSLSQEDCPELGFSVHLGWMQPETYPPSGIIPDGEPIITGNYGLPCSHIIHILRSDKKRACSETAKDYESALKLAQEFGIESIAFYFSDNASEFRIAQEICSTFLGHSEMQIFLCVQDEAIVRSENFSICELERFLTGEIMYPWSFPESTEECCSIDATIDQIESSTRRIEKSKPTDNFHVIQEFLKKNDAGFKDTLLKYIDRTGKKDSEVYKKANVDRRLFSKIMNVQGYNPSKPTAIAFAIALELNLEETKDLIGRAGYTLSQASTFDRIIEFFILEGNYDIYEINEALFYFDQSLLGC